MKGHVSIFDRADFPMLSQERGKGSVVFLDNAATTHKPSCVLEAMDRFYRTCYAPVHRGVYASAERATELFEGARETVARFIGAFPDEIIFTKGTTESINALAFMWALQHVGAGDEIAVTALEHHANLLPWQRVAAQRGARLRVLPILPDGSLDMQRARELIGPRTKLVAACMTSNVLGTQVDVRALARYAHEVGACILVDAAQSVPRQQVDVHELGCDFLVFSGHKMLGPTGIGVLYARREVQDQLEPYQLGGSMVSHVTYESAAWARAPRCFEAGTPPVAQAIGLAAAVEYLEKSDRNACRAHTVALCAALIDALKKIDGVVVLGPIEQLQKQGHLVSFVVRTMHAHDVAAAADQNGICVRAGTLCAQPLVQTLGFPAVVRASFYGYNTMDEVERLVAVIRACV